MGEKRWKEQGDCPPGGGGVKGSKVDCLQLITSHLETSSTLQLCSPIPIPTLINPNWGVDEMPPRRPVELRCRDAMLAASLPHGGGAHGTVAKS